MHFLRIALSIELEKKLQSAANARLLASKPFEQQQVGMFGPFFQREDCYLTSGKRGSVSFHVERIQTWFESSVTANARSDPARKFR